MKGGWREREAGSRAFTGRERNRKFAGIPILDSEEEEEEEAAAAGR